ncbi:MAG: hypothetical protein ACTSR8_05690 [Promethearchaeota archaeon]
MPKCNICGKEVANPNSKSHIESKFHQEALKKLEAQKKKNVAAKAKPAPKTKAKPKEKPIKEEKKKTQRKGAHPNWKKFEKHVQFIGKWAWVWVILNGLIYIIYGIWGLYWTSIASSLASTYGVYSYVAEDIAYLTGLYVWYLIGGIILIILGLFIVKKRFSDKCRDKKWDELLDDVIILGKYRIPFMLILGIVAEIFGQWWGGLTILIPALILIFWGPKEYQWKVKSK